MGSSALHCDAVRKQVSRMSVERNLDDSERRAMLVFERRTPAMARDPAVFAVGTAVPRGSIAAVLQAPFDPALARKAWNAYAASAS